MVHAEHEVTASNHAKTPDIRMIDTSEEHLQWLKIIELVEVSNVHNKDLCKIKVNSTWNFELLNALLVDYHDQQIVELLKYGFPIERDENNPLEMGGINHKGVTEFETEVDAYIQKELRHGAMIGPFENIPFKGQVAISPLNSHLKKGSNKR